MAKLLFKTFADLKQHVGTTQVMSTHTFQSSSLLAAERYIIPAIGREIYEDLADAFNGVPALSIAQAKLLPEVQRPLAFFTMLEASPLLTLQIGDAGIMEAAADHVTPVRQWVLRDSQESWLASGDLYTDLLLEFLEKNKEDFPLWTASSSFTLRKELTISTTAEFDDLLRINRSRRTFLALRPYIERAEFFYLQEVMGAALFTSYKAGLLATPVTDPVKALAKVAKPFVAYKAMVEAIPELNVQITGSGFKVLTTTDGISSKLLADSATLSGLQAKYQKMSDFYRQALFSFLEANAVTYPDYVSPLVDGRPAVTDLPDNSNTSSKGFIF